jgi:hypothetical protein
MEFRNYADEIRQGRRGSFVKVCRKIESMASALERLSRTDLGPSSVRPLSEILTPEIDLLLRKVAASEAVQKALNTGNAGIAHQHLRRSSRYAKTPSGSTVIFLASLESGRRALVDYSKETRCEAKAMVVAMTPPNGPTLLTHYLPRPPGLHIALDAGGLQGRKEDVISELELLVSYHEAREAYVAENREQLETVARREGREDLARSPESIDAIIRSACGLSEQSHHLWNYESIIGVSGVGAEGFSILFPRVRKFLGTHHRCVGSR